MSNNETDDVITIDGNDITSDNISDIIDLITKTEKLSTDNIMLYLLLLKNVKGYDIDDNVINQIGIWEDFARNAHKGDTSKYCQICLKPGTLTRVCDCGRSQCDECGSGTS